MWRLLFKGGTYDSAQNNTCCKKLQLNITNSPNYFDPYLKMTACKADGIDINTTYKILSRSCIRDIFIYV